MKRKLWIALALALLLALCCSAALAEKSGTCGENLTWTLTDKGLLTISGTGKMSSYGIEYIDGKSLTTAPWGIAPVRVVIESGVTSIGDYAFSSCSSLTSVTISNSVIWISSGAFEDCSSLTSVTIPSGMIIIGGSAFSGCSSLTSVTIPSSVTWIGDTAFSGCSSLTSINVNKNNAAYSSAGGVLFDKNETTIICCPGGFAGKYTIPSSVTSIGSNAFSGCSSLTSVTIPSSVTSVGEFAFSGCGSLTSITLPNSVTSIGEGAFYSCGSLTSVTIPSGVTSIGNSAFYHCSSLTSITIPSGVTSIGEWAFDSCNSLTSITIPSSVTSIGSGAFLSCSSLTSVTIPSSVTSIGNSTFYNCSSLTSVTIPSSVTSIGYSVFYRCSSLTSITIPAGVTSGGNNAFAYCWNLHYLEFLGKKTTFGTNVAYSENPTVYCYKNSDAASWAADSGYTCVYLDQSEASEIRVVSLPETYRMECGTNATVTPSVIPSSDHPSVKWKSSAPDIVSVKNGKLTANAPGTAVITATVDNASASMNVTSFVKAKSFQIPSEIWVELKGTAAIECTALQPKNATLFLNWTTGDSEIATMRQEGIVYGNKQGDTIITVKDTASGITRQTTVHVCQPVQSVKFSPTKAALCADGTVQLKAVVKTESATYENKMVQFTSSDDTIATVNSSGLVTGRKYGTVKITAEACSGAKATATVRVVDAILPTSLKTIPAEAFRGLAWKGVIIPEGCTSIGSRAFADCKNLQYVRIPASVTSITEDAFEGCGQVVIDRVE